MHTVSRIEIKRHISAASACVILGIIASMFLGIDRAPPVQFLSGSIDPTDARAGAAVTVHLLVQVNRICEGDLSRDIIGSDGVIHSYVRHFITIPLSPGMQDVDAQFTLPLNLPAGPATYQAKVSFGGYCGFTARFKPIDVYTPQISFVVDP